MPKNVRKLTPVVADPKTHAIMKPTFRGPVFRGQENWDFTCPHCGDVLAESVGERQFRSVVIECGNCHKQSAFPD